jgi:hypothetical protein
MRAISLNLLVACFAASIAGAQDLPKDLEPLPEPPPSVDEEGAPDEPQVTIIKRGEDRVEEYRIRGRLYMIKVTPPHGVPYYLVDEVGQGQFVRKEALDSGLVVPMWVILNF